MLKLFLESLLNVLVSFLFYFFNSLIFNNSNYDFISNLIVCLTNKNKKGMRINNNIIKK